MNRADELLLLRLAKVTHRTRAVLCALALRGKDLRVEQPARARCLLGVAIEHPFYKASRLVFDMAEVAEALREGPPPAHIDDELLAQLILPAIAKLDISDVRAACRAALEELGAQTGTAQAQGARPGRADWPLQEGADVLFDLIVLGALNEVLERTEGHQPQPVATLA
jgi:hypothetical protein